MPMPTEGILVGEATYFPKSWLQKRDVRAVRMAACLSPEVTWPKLEAGDVQGVRRVLVDGGSEARPSHTLTLKPGGHFAETHPVRRNARLINS
ncbi:uncharacterized protein GLRG_08038 [Colletotrichum graminicola M1.001]|uniref:Uncharacterized protein n=1 Tax=Colletotrichum graminicola (strain M1.001 / M2 / FGSC 10212) TaxID=645133 RepID=E3QPW7_COLGM|nr:uncharacterized protein GLRG_08038 [Colletotrichum graminicola M1.001]EFQ32894.1 hypothetical protein GLRG_08038 [Colletotrichum graminicola M1.001]